MVVVLDCILLKVNVLVFDLYHKRLYTYITMRNLSEIQIVAT